MSKSFYFKFAWSNLKKNSKMVIPFMLTCSLSVLMFYNCIALAENDVTGTGNLHSILMACSYFLGLFSTAFLFYTNSFLTKRRKKEFGLYNILGLEKKHINVIILIENFIIALVSIASGLVLGVLFSRLFTFILYKLVEFDIHYSFEINSDSLLYTLALFVVIFILISLSNIIVVLRTNVVDMLKGSQKAECVPKYKVITIIIGTITMISGYAIALTIDNIVTSIYMYLLAAVLVSIGTYCFFSAYSVIVLSAIKKNKKLFYKPENFTAISGLMYRIKKNVAGLSNICIISTAIILALSTTVSLYLGVEDSFNYRYPSDIQINAYTKEINTTINNNMYNDIEETFTEINDLKYLSSFYFLMNENGETAFHVENPDGSISTQPIDGMSAEIVIATNAQGYYNITGKNIELKNDEILLSTNEDIINSIYLLEKEYTVVQTDKEFISSIGNNAVFQNSMVIVMNDKEFNTFYTNSNQYDIANTYYFNLGESSNVNGETLSEFCDNRYKISDTYTSVYYDIKSENILEYHSLYGGILFVGIFLGILLLIYVLLIIYYKQVIEGYEDKHNYQIMKKVGMDKKLIKKSINKQIKMVFLIPIVTAIIHIIVSFKAIELILRMFNLVNTSLYINCTIGVIIAFFIIYSLMYYLTSKVYQRIINN